MNKNMSVQTGLHTLTQLGLTISQAMVYLTLIDMENSANAGTISARTNMARQEVYRVLSELQEKGLVVRIVETPTKFASIPLKDLAQILIENKKAEFHEMQDKITELMWTFRGKRATVREEALQFNLMSEKHVCIKRLQNAIKGAIKSIDFIITNKVLPQALVTFNEELKRSLEKQVQIRFIIIKTDAADALPENILTLAKDSSFRFRTVNNNTERRFIVLDDKEVFVSVSQVSNTGTSHILWSNASAFVELFRDHFTMMWNGSLEIGLGQ